MVAFDWGEFYAINGYNLGMAGDGATRDELGQAEDGDVVNRGMLARDGFLSRRFELVACCPGLHFS